jgi:hypothetical protein
MITRTAIFEGRIREGFERQFFEQITARLAPLWQRFPHSSNVRLLRVEAADEDSLPIVMIQQIDYPSYEKMQEALASPIRAEARRVTLEIMAMFEGRFYHVMGADNCLPPLRDCDL